MRRLIAHWWHGDGPWHRPLAALGTVSPHWMRQYRQQDRVEFHGVSWTWPVTTNPHTGEARDCGERAPSVAAACVHTSTA